MSAFRRRLAVRTGQPVRTGQKAPPEEAGDDALPSTAMRLERLRSALAHACGAPPPRPMPHRARVTLPPMAEAPFAWVDGVYERGVRRSADATVGRVPIGWAAHADPDWLSRMALDGGLATCSPRGALFLDTETTGLGGGTGNVPFLVGLAWFDETGPRFEQLWLRDLDEEPEMLERLRVRLEATEMLVTYNGKSFDLPVLRSRYLMNGLPPPADRPHLDLLHLARRVHKGRTFRKSLTELERRVLGYLRGHDVGGEEVARRYLAYLRDGDASPLGEVVVHNERDIWSLLALTGLYGAPLDRLDAEDLPWLARCVRRAGDLPRAGEVATTAVARGVGLEALRAQGEIAKACGEKDLALKAFEAAEVLAVEAEATLASSEIRLELCKLYEHHRRDPASALRIMGREATAHVEGELWAEKPEATAHRRARLRRKIGRHSTEAEAIGPFGDGTLASQRRLG